MKPPRKETVYLSLWDWWEAYQPDIFSMMHDPLTAYHRDGIRLHLLGKARGIVPIQIEAPEVFKDFGVVTIYAYPKELIDDLYKYLS
jgi:hypothetical protein